MSPVCHRAPAATTTLFYFFFFSLGLAMQQMIDVQREIQCQQINTVMYILHDDLLRISCLFITRLFIFLYS